MHIRLAHCHQQLNRLSEARQEFAKALDLIDRTDAAMRAPLRSLVKQGLLECSSMESKLMLSSSPSEPVWKCTRPSPPRLTNFASEGDPGGESCYLVSASRGTVRLRNTGNKRGWTLEVIRDVPAGKRCGTELSSIP